MEKTAQHQLRKWNSTHRVELPTDAASLWEGGGLSTDVAEDTEDHVAEEEEVATGRDASHDDEGKLVWIKEYCT